MRTILMDSFHIVLNKLRFAHNLQQRRDPSLHDTNETWSSSTTWIKPSILNENKKRKSCATIDIHWSNS